jgi:hypothetical protein
MASSLLPEKPLVVSPSLAATIGLEEAVLLTVLHELFVHRAQSGWLKVDSALLQHFLPFWQPQDVQRIAASLCATGILHLRISAAACWISIWVTMQSSQLFPINRQQFLINRQS